MKSRAYYLLACGLIMVVVCIVFLVPLVLHSESRQGLTQGNDEMSIRLALMCLSMTACVFAICLGIRRDVREIREQLKQMKSLNDEEDNHA